MLSDVNLWAKLAATKQGKIIGCFAQEVYTQDKSLAHVPLSSLVFEIEKTSIEKKWAALPSKTPVQVN
jgi:hypothetical protein